MAGTHHVIVIGAGVIGLQTAVTLLQSGYTVSIVAQHWPDTSMEDGEYTSAWAGAQWRTHAARGSEAANWDAQTYRHWETLLKDTSTEQRASIGVFPIKLTEYRAIPPDPSTPWWSSLSPSFTHLAKDMIPTGYSTGMSMDSFVVYPAAYLAYLLKMVTKLGAKLHRNSLPTADGLAGLMAAAKDACSIEADGKQCVFVNATGLLARNFLLQETMTPVRGQTLLVKGEAQELKTMIGSKPGEVLAIIPRVGTGTTIVGATRGPGRSDLEPDTKDTEWLSREAKVIAPELFVDGKLDIFKINVGLRPHRETGARVEVEKVEGLGEDVVIHAYGHDGAGYQNSVGCANKVLQLVGESRSTV